MTKPPYNWPPNHLQGDEVVHDAIRATIVERTPFPRLVAGALWELGTERWVGLCVGLGGRGNRGGCGGGFVECYVLAGMRECVCAELYSTSVRSSIACLWGSSIACLWGAAAVQWLGHRPAALLMTLSSPAHILPLPL